MTLPRVTATNLAEALAAVRAARKRLKRAGRSPHSTSHALRQVEFAKEVAFAEYVKQLPGVTT